MDTYAVEYDYLNERQLRSYIRESIIFEYNDTKRIRAFDPLMFDILNEGPQLLNEFLGGLFRGAGELISGGISGFLAPIKKKVGGFIARKLGLQEDGIGRKAIVAFFEKTGVKDMFNIIRGKAGCGKLLIKFTQGLVKLIVKDIPRLFGADPKGAFVTGLQKRFGDPVNDMAEKLATFLCSVKWGELLRSIPGFGLIARFLPGGKNAGQKMNDKSVTAVFTELPKDEKQEFAKAAKDALDKVKID